MDDHPEFTIIKCSFQRQFGPIEYDYFVKLDGRWTSIGSEDYQGDDGYILEKVTAGYDTITVVNSG